MVNHLAEKLRKMLDDLSVKDITLLRFMVNAMAVKPDKALETLRMAYDEVNQGPVLTTIKSFEKFLEYKSETLKDLQNATQEYKKSSKSNRFAIILENAILNIIKFPPEGRQAPA